MKHYLYRLHDAEGALLYIGCSAEPWGRVRAHNLAQPWGDQIASVAIEGPFARAEAFQQEKEAIAAECPRYNVVHNLDPVVPAKPTHEAVHFVSQRCTVGRASIRRAMRDGELPLEPTEHDVWRWLQVHLDTVYHRYPCAYLPCRCATDSRWLEDVRTA